MSKYIPAFLLVALGLFSRVLPHPANFAPIAGIALFAGIYLPKKLAIIVPLVAMALSDFIIGTYQWQIMLTVYLAFIVTGLIGLVIKNNNKFRTVLGGTLLASIIFFISTNWAVWAFGTMYPHTLNGLLQSYLMALPFFRNTILGDLFYVGVLVGGMELILKVNKHQILSMTNIKY
jgi:hypothetical protein